MAVVKTETPCLSTVLLTRTLEQGQGPGQRLRWQGPGPGLGCQGPGQGQGLESEGHHPDNDFDES